MPDRELLRQTIYRIMSFGEMPTLLRWAPENLKQIIASVLAIYIIKELGPQEQDKSGLQDPAFLAERERIARLWNQVQDRDGQ